MDGERGLESLAGGSAHHKSEPGRHPVQTLGALHRGERLIMLLPSPRSNSSPSARKRSSGDAVDVVVAWVDGRDPEHRAKRKRYLADPGGDAKLERVAHLERRFSDNDEIRFCLRWIRNYAPWARTIWLVTDDQVPAAIDRRKA